MFIIWFARFIPVLAFVHFFCLSFSPCQAAGQEHSWFHHFSLRWPSASDGDDAGAGAGAGAGGGADVAGYGSIAAAAAPSRGRDRVATFDAGDPNHRPPPPVADPEPRSPAGTSEEKEAPVATVGGGVEEGEGGDDGGRSLGNSSTPVRLFRLGPLTLPVCFFGGGARG